MEGEGGGCILPAISQHFYKLMNPKRSKRYENLLDENPKDTKTFRIHPKIRNFGFGLSARLAAGLLGGLALGSLGSIIEYE